MLEGVKMIEQNYFEEKALGLATTDKDGNPYNIVVGYMQVVSNNKLLVSDNYFGLVRKFTKKNF